MATHFGYSLRKDFIFRSKNDIPAFIGHAHITRTLAVRAHLEKIRSLQSEIYSKN